MSINIRVLPFLVTLALTLTAAVRTASAQDSSFVPTATTIPCPIALPAGEVEGQTMTCGQVSVPEGWDDTAGKQITISYALLSFTAINLLNYYLSQFEALAAFFFNLAVFLVLLSYRNWYLTPRNPGA